MSTDTAFNVVELPTLPAKARKWLEDYRAKRAEPAAPVGDAKRRLEARLALVRYMDGVTRQLGMTVSAAADLLTHQIAIGALPTAIASAAQDAARADKPCPARSRLLDWYGKWSRGGAEALADRYTGRRRTYYGWEALALSLWLRPGRQDAGAIGFVLRAAGHATATYPRVRSFLRALPATIGDYAPQRIGHHYHAQNVKHFQRLTYQHVPVGAYFEGDGHTVDWYCGHPRTGRAFRAEVQVWIDKRSRFVPGWYLWDRESGINTLFALSRAILAHDHVPGAVHVDPGSGFKNRMMCDEVMGFFARLSIQPIFALPGNARAKGHIEGWFGHMERRAGKLMPTYCGADRTDDGLRRMERQIALDKLRVPTWEESIAVLGWYVDAYNSEPQQDEDGRWFVPAELWEKELRRTPVELPAAAIVRPMEARVVQQECVTFRKRVYRDPVLSGHEGRRVLIEINIGDLRHMRVLTPEMHFICEARRVDRKPGLANNLLDDIERQRVLGQIRRKERAIDEVLARAGLRAIGSDRTLHFLDVAPAAALTKTGGSVEPPAVQPVFPGSPTGIEFDLDDTDYL